MRSDAQSRKYFFRHCTTGGNQEARGSAGCGDLYIENLIEEIDVPMEFFLDTESNVLYYIPESGVNMTTAVVEGTALTRLIQFRGSDSNTPVKYISFVGMNISRSAPTYMQSYEAPSGGDWSIHRGGAVFLDGAEGDVQRCYLSFFREEEIGTISLLP